MNTTVMLYLFTRLDSIHSLFLVLFISGILWLTSCLVRTIHTAETYGHGDCKKEKYEEIRKQAKKVMWSMFFLALVKVAVPTERDMAVIVGGTLAVDAAVAVAPEAKVTLGKIQALVNGKLDEEIAKLGKPDKEEK